MGKVGQLGVEMWFVLQTILTFWWILYSFGQISWVRKEINSVKHLGTWCLSSQHTQDSTVRVELSGAELGDADLKAGRERAWQTHFLFYARTFPKAFSLLLAFPCFFLFQIFVQEAQVSFHQFPSCVSFGSLELSVSALLCRIYCCIIVYFCVSFYFTQSFIFRVFFSFSRVFPSLTACPESEFHDASRSWCSTLMITCSDTRMRTAALHLPTSVFLRSFQLDSRLSATYCLFFFSLNFILDVLFASKPRPLCDEHRPVLQLLCYRQWCRIAFGAFPSEVAGHPSGFHQMTCAWQRFWEIRPIPFS